MGATETRGCSVAAFCAAMRLSSWRIRLLAPLAVASAMTTPHNQSANRCAGGCVTVFARHFIGPRCTSPSCTSDSQAK